MSYVELSDRAHVVYRCYDARDRLLYVGCTVNLASRLKEHRYTELGRRWMPLLARVETTAHTNRADALESERQAISAESPIFNVVHNHDPFCAVEGCDEDYAVKGYCTNHYWRWVRYGDPLEAPPWESAGGLSSHEVCKAVGVTYRQLDYWCRQGLMTPSLCDANGSGTRRRYSTDDVLAIQNLKTAAEIIAAVQTGDIWERVQRGEIAILTVNEHQAEAAA